MKIFTLIESFLSSRQELVDSNVFYPSTSTSNISSGNAFSSSRTSRTYRELKRECLRQGRLFIDSEFPPSNESLFLDESRWSGTDLEIEWKRPGEIVDDPKLFVEGASPFDVTQGILGNCWFVSACSALTNSDALLCKVIPNGQDTAGSSYAGIFQFCFWRFGRWIDIIVDDLLPCKGGKLLFARSKTDNEFWSALLEKAFAKFYGCYENLVGGQLADALQDVSGGVVETLDVRRFMYQYTQIMKGLDNTENFRVYKVLNNLKNGNLTSLSVYKADCSASKRLFYTLKHAFNREALIVAAISAKNEEVERSLDCGLVMGHAYAITAIQFIELDASHLINKSRPDRDQQTVSKRQAMVRLQNPWGEKEWDGPWSDGAEEWEQITSEQKHRLGVTDSEDGEFWMPWEKFLEYFTDISVCQLLMPLELGISRRAHLSMKASRKSNITIISPVDRRYYEWDFYGCWTTNGVKSGAPQDRSGGCPNFSATFCFNPQFLLDVPGPGPAEVIFALNQPDLFLGKKRLPYLAAGMQIMRVERNRRQRLHRPLPSTATSEYSSGRSVYLHLEKLSPGRYILIPSSFAPKEVGEFLLRIYSTQRLNPCLLENDIPMSALCRFGIRIRCLIRLHILEINIPSYKQRKDVGGLFCLITTSTGERIRTIGLIRAGPELSFKFNGECFLFHSLCPSINFTIEVFEKHFPFHLGNKCLGCSKILVNAEQNDRLRFDLVLRKSFYNLGCSDGQIIGMMRLEISAYDDPFYL